MSVAIQLFIYNTTVDGKDSWHICAKGRSSDKVKLSAMLELLDSQLSEGLETQNLRAPVVTEIDALHVHNEEVKYEGRFQFSTEPKLVDVPQEKKAAECLL